MKRIRGFKHLNKTFLNPKVINEPTTLDDVLKAAAEIITQPNKVKPNLRRAVANVLWLWQEGK